MVTKVNIRIHIGNCNMQPYLQIYVFFDAFFQTSQSTKRNQKVPVQWRAHNWLQITHSRNSGFVDVAGSKPKTQVRNEEITWEQPGLRSWEPIGEQHEFWLFQINISQKLLYTLFEGKLCDLGVLREWTRPSLENPRGYCLVYRSVTASLPNHGY